MVAAAGNNATTDAMYPAAYDGVISVSAATIDEDLASYSSYGESVDVAAPGGASSDTNGDGYAAMPMQPFPSAHTRPMSTGLAWSPWIRMPTAWALIENVDFITDINLNLSTDSQSVTPALPLYLETE